MIEMSRRTFLKGMAGILASGFAPAVVGSNILMPVKTIIVPKTIITPFSGLREDACSTPETWNDFQEWVEENLRERDALRRLLKL